jgi:transposase
MKIMFYIGMDVHKKTISYCIKTKDGKIVKKGIINATREALIIWLSELNNPWMGAMEATMFTGWIYDFLKPYAVELKVAHPAMLKAITASKKKSDKSDAEKIADLLRCDLLPECYMAATEIRELRRILRYRNMMVQEAVRMKNRMAGLLMETGIPYNKRKLYGRKYFSLLLDSIKDMPSSLLDLLRLSRSNLEIFTGIQKRLIDVLNNNEIIRERVRRLLTIKGVGEVTALTWVLETGDSTRFKEVGQAISYCGLCSAQKESAGKNYRGPISKQRNKHLQTILIEAAKLAPRWNQQLAEVHARESAKGNPNRATLAVARKLVAYMLAVDKGQKDFEAKSNEEEKCVKKRKAA